MNETISLPAPAVASRPAGRVLAPEMVRAGIYEVTTRARLGVLAGAIEETRLYVLSDDGTYAAVYGDETGRWSYVKTGAGTAEVVRVPRAPGNRAKAVLEQLAFDGPTGGRLTVAAEDDGNASLTHSFALHPFTEGSRLANVSCRAAVRAGERVFVGFVVRKSGSLVLVRAVGPGLRGFGVAHPLAAPVLEVPGLGVNRGWFTADVGRPGLARLPEERHRVRGVTRFFGAFSLAEDANDCAVQGVLAAGDYVAEVSSADAVAGGEVLLEVYVFP